MKFTFSSLLSLALTAAPAFSQNIMIGAPADQTTVAAGSNITVEVDRPDSLTPSIENGIVIGIPICPNGQCFPPDVTLAPILYNGPYNPQFPPPPSPKPPHQNFTLTIPSSTGKGLHQLVVWHVAIVGAGSAPLSQFRNITLNIV